MKLDALVNRDIQFTVSTAVDQVAATLVLGNQLFQNADGDTKFQAGDNVKIRELRILLPYQFGQGDFSQASNFTLLFSDLTTIPELGDASAIFTGNPCQSIDLDLFIQAKTLINYGFVLGNIVQNVSMLGTPAALDGQTLEADIWMLVEHTLDMVP